MTLEEVKNNDEIKKVHQALSKAILKAVKKGPCIIHERVAGDVLAGKVDCLKVLLYNTSMEHCLFLVLLQIGHIIWKN